MKVPFRLFAAFASCLFSFWTSSQAEAAKIPPSSANSAIASGEEASPGSYLQMVDVPGPLDSFLRMAGISQEITPADVLPLLARNAFLYGHVGDRRTEYLVLADRYVQLARELRPLAGPDGMIRVTGCGDVGTADSDSRLQI